MKEHIEYEIIYFMGFILIFFCIINRYLGVTGQQYGRPIHGQNEVVGLSRPGVQAKWQTMEGVFIKSTDFSEDVRVFHDPSEL